MKETSKPMRRYPLLTMPAKLFVLSLLVILPGCATRTSLAVPTDRVATQSFKPIYWSKKDTDKTIAQIKEHNAAYKAVTFKDRWHGGIKNNSTVFR